MVAERDEVGNARSEAERMMELGRPVAYKTVRRLLSGLSDANNELVRVRSDRDRWQEAYCEARLQARQRDAQQGPQSKA